MNMFQALIRMMVTQVGFPGGSIGFNPWVGKNPGDENGNPLQYSCLENSWTEELGGLQSMGLQRVGHDLATKQQQQQRNIA